MKKAVLTTILALCAASAFATIRAVSHDMYGGNANSWQVKRHNEKMSVVTNGGAKANDIIKNFADGKKVVWVDFNAKFLDEKGDNVALMPDHCHPNGKGYAEVWLPSVLPYFKKACGK